MFVPKYYIYNKVHTVVQSRLLCPDTHVLSLQRRIHQRLDSYEAPGSLGAALISLNHVYQLEEN